jgi:hypothetical protein
MTRRRRDGQETVEEMARRSKSLMTTAWTISRASCRRGTGLRSPRASPSARRKQPRQVHRRRRRPPRQRTKAPTASPGWASSATSWSGWPPSTARSRYCRTSGPRSSRASRPTRGSTEAALPTRGDIETFRRGCHEAQGDVRRGLRPDHQAGDRRGRSRPGGRVAWRCGGSTSVTTWAGAR